MNIPKDRFDLAESFKYPIILSAHDIKSTDIERIILNAIQESSLTHSDKSFIEFHAFRSFYFRESLDHNYADLTNSV